MAASVRNASSGYGIVMTDFMNRFKRGLRARDGSSKGTPKPGEIWWVSMLDGIKDRPILVLDCQKGNVRFLKCTSQVGMERNRKLIEDYYEAGLEKATYVDPEVRVIARSELVKKMGSLSEYDRQKFNL